MKIVGKLKPFTIVCLVSVVAIYVAIFAWRLSHFQMGPPPRDLYTGVAESGDDNISYTYYTGPVFAMTAMEESLFLSVERNLNYDFSLYGEEYNRECLIRDTYSLTNSSKEDQTVKLLYPFVTRITGYNDQLPDIRINGTSVYGVSRDEEIDPDTKSRVSENLHFGPNYYTMSRLLPENSLNYQDSYGTLSSYRDFKTLFEGNYQSKAFETAPEMNQKVTVYEFDYSEDYWSLYENANETRVYVYCKMDESKTAFLTYDFFNFDYDTETDTYIRGFYIHEPEEVKFYNHKYFILLGEEPEQLKMKVLVGNPNEKREELTLEEAGIHVNRYESTVSDMIHLTATIYLEQYQEAENSDGNQTMVAFLSPDTLTRLTEEMLDSWGFFTDPERNIAEESLNNAFENVTMDQRIAYLSFEVEIPAGESVEIVAQYKKEASDNEEEQGEAMNLKGYSMLPKIGSNLNFAWQTASVSNYSYVEIVNQNFGFDLEKGITKVDLDLQTEEYYLELRSLTENE